MSLARLAGLIRRTGRSAEPAPAAPDGHPGRPTELAGSVQIRHVDAGSAGPSARSTTRSGTAHAWSPRHDMPTSSWSPAW